MNDRHDQPACRFEYSKAYPAQQLAAYALWSPAEDGRDPSAILFLHADHVVRSGPSIDDKVVFEDGSAEWKTFCREQLNFGAALDNLMHGLD